MITSKTSAIALTVLFLTLSLAPLATAQVPPEDPDVPEPSPGDAYVVQDAAHHSEEYAGDVVVNGAFANTLAAGHREKIYDPNASRFFAYDWRHDSGNATFAFGAEGGLQVTLPTGGTVILQQYMNGDLAPDRPMNFSGAAVTGRVASGTGNVAIDVRTDVGDDNVVENRRENVVFTASTQRFAFGASDFGLTAGEEVPIRALRIWLNGAPGATFHLDRVSLYATNGVEGRGFLVKATGDDGVTPVDGAVVHSPGLDGAYSFFVSLADDQGTPMPTESGLLCVYTVDGLATDGYSPGRTGCPNALLAFADTTPYRTVDGDGFRFDIPAHLFTAPGPYFVWGNVEYGATSGGVFGSDDKWLGGFYHVLRDAADAVNLGVAYWYGAGTPVLFAPDAQNTLATSARFSEEYNGDVVVNGAFANARPVAPAGKFYSPLDGDFVAYDWMANTDAPATFEVTEDGLVVTRTGPGDVTLQQWFNGSAAPDRRMKFHGMAIQGRAVNNTAAVELDIRLDADGDGDVESIRVPVSFTSESKRVTFTATQLGLVAGEEYKVRSVRLWIGASPVVLEGLSVYATNGVEGRGFLIAPAGDDVVSVDSGVAVQQHGVDGKYSWFLSLADDQGTPLATENAVLCVYALDGVVADGGSPTGDGKACDNALLTITETTPYRVRDGKGFRYDIPAEILVDPAGAPIVVGVWGGVEYDATSGGVFGANLEKWLTGFYHAARNAADAADFGVAYWYGVGTPVILGNAGPLTTPTVVVRFSPEANQTVTPLGAATAVETTPDGTVVFEYALLRADGTAATLAAGQHKLALYDAPGFFSDDVDPEDRRLETFDHALYAAEGQAIGDGWYRVTVPASALEAAKGAVGAYATVTVDGDERISFYNGAKEAAYGTNLPAAAALSLTPTPIIVVDHALGVPLLLASAAAAQPGDLLSFTNPFVNPGFEVDMGVEMWNVRAIGDDAYSANMVSPPWILRLGGKTYGEHGNPRSTHSVATGQGPLGSNALRVKYNTADKGWDLFLGQHFGYPDASAPFVWKNATRVSFDVKTTGAVTFAASVRYVSDATGNLTGATTPAATVTQTGLWQRVTLTFPTPVAGELVSFYLFPAANQNVEFLVDNFVLEGATTVLGDARSDIADQMAMIIEPAGLVTGGAPGNVQGAFEGTSGDYFVYEFEGWDYRSGGAQVLDLATIPENMRVFGYFTEAGLEMNVGSVLKLRNASDRLAAVVPVADAPAVAAPWAYLGTGDVYVGFDQDVHEPVSGYYNPLKNDLRASSLADHLDYAGTPVVLDASTSAGSLVAQQTLSVRPMGDGTYRVVIAVDSPFVETTEVRYTRAGVVVGHYPVTLDSASGNVVDGLVIPASDISLVAVKSNDTLFTRGAETFEGAVNAAFTYCLVVNETVCDATATLKTGDTVRFTSTSTSTSGEGMVYQWRFGNAPFTTTAAPSTERRFSASGPLQVTLKVTTASGKNATATEVVTIADRAPVVNALTVSPATPSMFDMVTVTARATDPEAQALAYAWTLNGFAVDVPVTTTALVLNESLLENATGSATLLRGTTYVVDLLVTDAAGLNATGSATFTVSDLPLGVGLASIGVDGVPGATYSLLGETVTLTAVVKDADDAVAGVVATFVSNETSVVLPLALVDVENNTYGNLTALVPVGEYEVYVNATNALDATASTTLAWSVRENLAPVVNLTGDALVESFETAEFTVNPVDPDGRGIATIQWFVDGVEVPEASGNATFVYEAGNASGTHAIKAVVTDVGGAASEETLTLGVDDVLVGNATVAPGSVTSPTVITVVVANETGAFVDDAVVNMTVYNMAGLEVAKASRVTGSDGTVTWTVPRTYLGTFTAPGEYTLVAEITAPGGEGMPNAEPETIVLEMSYLVGVL